MIPLLSYLRILCPTQDHGVLLCVFLLGLLLFSCYMYVPFVLTVYSEVVEFIFMFYMWVCSGSCNHFAVVRWENKIVLVVLQKINLSVYFSASCVLFHWFSYVNIGMSGPLWFYTKFWNWKCRFLNFVHPFLNHFGSCRSFLFLVTGCQFCKKACWALESSRLTYRLIWAPLLFHNAEFSCLW